MPSAIVQLSLLIDDYDSAIEYFTTVMRFELLEDRAMGPDKRWVVVAPPGGQGARLLLARASDEAQRQHIGNQTGGRVFLFLETEDFESDYQHLLAHGTRFTEAPRDEAYGRVVVFIDRYGNKWDLIQRR